MRYRIFRGCIVERLPDGTLIDPILANIARHHGVTEDEQATIRRFCTISGYRTEHLDILLMNMGRGLPFLGKGLVVRMLEKDVFTSSVHLPEGYQWTGSELTFSDVVVPEMIRTDLKGYGLGVLIRHPYLPDDLAMAQVASGKSSTRVTFSVKRPPRPAPDDVS